MYIMAGCGPPRPAPGCLGGLLGSLIWRHYCSYRVSRTLTQPTPPPGGYRRAQLVTEAAGRYNRLWPYIRYSHTLTWHSYSTVTSSRFFASAPAAMFAVTCKAAIIVPPCPCHSSSSDQSILGADSSSRRVISTPPPLE